MKMILNYYDQDDGSVLEALELNLDNDKFDPIVADKFAADFDRCEHGRHSTDVCNGCAAAYGSVLSRGNPGNYEETWYDIFGNRIYAFALSGTAGWVVVDDELVVSLELP